jgi:hypothetical protein
MESNTEPNEKPWLQRIQPCKLCTTSSRIVFLDMLDEISGSSYVGVHICSLAHYAIDISIFISWNNLVMYIVWNVL